MVRISTPCTPREPEAADPARPAARICRGLGPQAAEGLETARGPV